MLNLKIRNITKPLFRKKEMAAQNLVLIRCYLSLKIIFYSHIRLIFGILSTIITLTADQKYVGVFQQYPVKECRELDA